MGDFSPLPPHSEEARRRRHGLDRESFRPASPFRGIWEMRYRVTSFVIHNAAALRSRMARRFSFGIGSHSPIPDP